MSSGAQNILDLKLRYDSYWTLHAEAQPVAHGSDLGWLIDFMWDTMEKHDGIGLAANQVGSLHRVITVKANGFKQEFINPVIERRYGGQRTSKEGCLSFPGTIVSKSRYRQVVVSGFDRDWNPIRRKVKGLVAYCVQHEVDHLNGITIAGNGQSA